MNYVNQIIILWKNNFPHNSKKILYKIGKNQKFDDYLLKCAKKEIANEDFLEMPETQNALKNFFHTGYFAIVDEGLLIQYRKYDIAPGSDGNPSLIVPKNILKEFMGKDIYEFCFSNKTYVEEVAFCK